jgi:two-component system cell cycle sensor histidine kinase/response regulator CckA
MGFARSLASEIMSTPPALSAEQQQQSNETLGRGGVSRGRYVVLQSLVGVMLGYQLVFGPEPIVSRVTSELIVGGLVLLITCLLAAPASLLQAAWFSGTLITIDTVLVTGTMYLSGHARAELYLSYFILMLIAASLRRLSHVVAFSLLLCAGYGVVLYQGAVQTGALSVGHLLGVPVLLVMAVFYGMALETIGAERQQKIELLQNIEELRKAEKTLQVSREQLEIRIQGLKGDLWKANALAEQEKSERQGLERQLFDAQKMETIGRITSGLANEFSHLFSVIGKQTGVVLAHLLPEDPLYRAVDEIFRTGEQAAALTAQLAALENQHRQFRHVLSMRAVIEDLSETIRELLPDRIDCRIAIESGPLDVEVDREGIEQMLLNLTLNARDAMPQRGRLTIEIGPDLGGIGGKPLFGSKGRSSTVLIQVSDTGSGMTRETQARMFEPFFSTKETSIGLGLTSVYGVVKQHGGQLEVTSQPGQGTTVRIYLPAVAASVTSQPVESSVAAKGQETVLLVEPHEIERKLAVSTLRRHRYQVLEASSPVEAIMLAHSYTGAVHLTISGLIMPQINGRELAKRLLKQHPTMKALFVSGYDDDAIISHRINRRCLLRRPYRQTGLVEKVRELIDA